MESKKEKKCPFCGKEIIVEERDGKMVDICFNPFCKGENCKGEKSKKQKK